MKTEILKNALLAFHQPELNIDCNSIYIVYSDGELVFTKCGSLLFQRTQHLMEHKFHGKLDDSLFPCHYANYGFIMGTKENMYKARELIKNALVSEDRKLII